MPTFDSRHITPALTSVYLQGAGAATNGAVAPTDNMRGVATPSGIKFLTFQSSLTPCHEEDLRTNDLYYTTR